MTTPTDTPTQTVGQREAADWFTIAPHHRTKENLAEAIDNAVKPLVSALEQARRQITLARCTLERKIQASDYVRSSHESDPAQYVLAGMICEDINEFIHLAHGWTEKAEKSVERAIAALEAQLAKKVSVTEMVEIFVTAIGGFDGGMRAVLDHLGIAHDGQEG